MSKNENPNIATQTLPTGLEHVHTCNWVNKWQVKRNEHKSLDVVFAKCHDNTSEITLNNKPKAEIVKYLGHLIRLIYRLNETRKLFP